MPMYFGPVGSEPAEQIARHAGHVVALHEDGLLLRFEVETPDSPIESFLGPDQAVTIAISPRSPPPWGVCMARGVIINASVLPTREAKRWTVRVRYTEMSPEDRDYLYPSQA